MGPRQSKLEQWRNKTEREKHTLAVLGAVVCTSVIILIWAYNFAVSLETRQENAQTAVDTKQFSPLAPIRDLFTENITKIGAGLDTVKGSAAAVLGSGKAYIRSEN